MRPVGSTGSGEEYRVGRAHESPGERLAGTWKRLSPWPGGKWIFSRVVGGIVPYTGTIGARFEELRPGYARIVLRDRRKVRNHLNCVHAVALVNLGEVTSGMAMMMGLDSSVRGIVTGLSIEYQKKARGRLVAESRIEVPRIVEPTEQPVVAEIRDASGDVVSRLTAHWLLTPRGAA